MSPPAAFVEKGGGGIFIHPWPSLPASAAARGGRRWWQFLYLKAVICSHSSASKLLIHQWWSPSLPTSVDGTSGKPTNRNVVPTRPCAETSFVQNVTFKRSCCPQNRAIIQNNGAGEWGVGMEGGTFHFFTVIVYALIVHVNYFSVSFLWPLPGVIRSEAMHTL